VQNGADPSPHKVQNGNAIATFAHDRVVSGIQPAATQEEDKRLLREAARNVVTEMVRTPHQKSV